MIERALKAGVDCHLCGERIGLADEIDVDHVVPVAAGGSDHISNLALAHASCNRSKGARA